MVVHTKDIAVEAVKWTGVNHEELIAVFDMEILDFGYNEDVYVGETHAYPGDYLVKAGDEVLVFGERQFRAIFTTSRKAR